MRRTNPPWQLVFWLALSLSCKGGEPAGSEDVFIACMAEYGFEVTSVDLTPGREDVALAAHDRSLEEVLEATAICEERSLGGGSEVEISGDDLQLDVRAVVDAVDRGGVVALVVRNGVATEATGSSANASGDLLTADSRFNIASVSKTYTATLVYRLEDRGLLDSDASLNTYLPDLPYGPEVTLDALLTHTSGVPDYAANPDYLAAVLAEPDRIFTPADLLGYAASLPAHSEGEFSYSNTGYLLLGLVVEEVAQAELAEVMQAEIFGPLGLTDTSLAEPPDFPSGLVSARVDPESLGLPADPPPPVMPIPAALSGCQADCGVVTTLSDTRVFFEALFEGPLLSEASRAKMTTAGEGVSEYARGLEIYEGEDGRSTFGHGGGGAGYSARVAYDPVSTDLVVFFGNNDVLEVNALFDAYRP